MSLFIRVRRLSGMAIAWTLAALCLASVAAAQQYRTDPIDDSVKHHGAKTLRWVGNPTNYASDKANFTDYFQKYYFPAMTRHSPSDLAELGKMRFDLFKRYLWATTNQDLQRDLTALAYEPSLRVSANLVQLRPKPIMADPPYHPAVRYNAVLVLGMLDSEYAIESGSNPKPLPGATKALTQIVNLATTGNRFPPPVILGALIGLERHAKYHQSLAPDAVKAMSTALLKFVNQDKSIQGMDPDAYAWLRLRAASALANLGSLGDKNAVHDALIKLISSSESLDDRCAAAALLGSFKYDKAKVDGPATTNALLKLASDLSAEELKRAKDFERGAGGYAASPEFMQNDPNAPQDSYPRRHVLARLINLRTGLTAVKPAVPAESQKQVDAILAAIRPVIRAASDEKTISRRVADTVRTMSNAIAATVGAADSASDDEEEFSAGGPPPAAAAPVAAPPAAAGTAPAAESPPAAARPERAKN